MKADDVEKWAERDDVASVTPDRQVKLLGHVTLPSGTAAAATTGGLSKSDGAGLGLVMMDSGIDSTPFASADNNGHSRVVYSQDFTGEGRTDAPYGHGTHAASLAVGSGVVASGAYLGVAPAAKIINLRVLDSQGRGDRKSTRLNSSHDQISYAVFCLKKKKKKKYNTETSKRRRTVQHRRNISQGSHQYSLRRTND